MPSQYARRERPFQADARDVAELWKRLPEGYTPPSDVATERSLLGAAMIDKRSAEAIVTEIGNPSMADSPFYEERHATIYKAIAHMASLGETVDLVTVRNFLSKHGKLEAVGGSPYLVEITQQIVRTDNVRTYAKIVQEKRLARDLLIHTLGVQARLYGNEDVFEVQRELEATLDTLRSGVRRDRQPPVAMGSLLSTSLRDAALAAGDTGLAGTPTGLRGVDDITGGLMPGDLSIVAARPSVGKTLSAITIAKNICSYPVEEKRVGIGFFSIEMTKNKIALRLLACEAQVSSDRIRRNELSNGEYDRLMQACNRMDKWPIMIQDDPRTTALDVRSQVRLLQRKGCGLVIVDYLQILKTVQAGETREREVNEITQQLKDTAKLLNVHVMALAQLNRGAEMGGKARAPVLSDLRESGAIEQIADVVMFIHRPNKGEWYDNGEPCKWIIAKNRDGAVGEVDLKVFPYYSLLEDSDAISIPQAGTTSAPPEPRNFYEPERDEPLYESEGAF